MTKYLILFFTIILLLGCKKEYNVEYTIENDSQRKLLINFQKLNVSRIDSNEINSGQQLTFLVEMDEGQKTEKYLENISEIPLDFLEITDRDLNKLSCNPIIIDCWIKDSPQEKEGIGRVLLNVREFDFE